MKSGEIRGKMKKNEDLCNFFGGSDVKCHRVSSTFAANFKTRTIMLTYQLLKIAPDGGQFAASTLGLLFGLMEVGLVIWYIVGTLING